MKISNSWSKPDGVLRLIARKQVDKSIFVDGSHIPEAFHEDFAQANGGHLPALGESREVTLVHGNDHYTARLSCLTRLDRGGSRLLLQYNRRFAKLLQERLGFSYGHLVIEAEAKVDRSPDSIPEADREYVEFYETGEPYWYEVNLVERPRESERTNGPVPPSSFDQVWADLGRIIGAGTTVRTLSQEVINTISWIESEGIRVSTERGTNLLPKTMFETTWDTLVRRGIVPADELPKEARFRSTAVCSILAQLPYVGYTTYPRTTLFVSSHRFTNIQIARTFGVGVMGGIRVKGRSPDTKMLAFITDPSGSHSDHPYQDRWEGETFFYTGEGLTGPQEMKKGNLTLKNSITGHFPVYGFKKIANDSYILLGRFKVIAVHEEQQPDSAGGQRRVFVFEMQLVRSAATAENPLPLCQPQVFRIAAPRNPQLWASCLESSLLPLEPVGPAADLHTFASEPDLRLAIVRELSPIYEGAPSVVRRRVEELMAIRALAPGDRLIITKGPSTIVGLAEIETPGYIWIPGEARHAIKVKLKWVGTRRVARQPQWQVRLISASTQELYDAIAQSPPTTEPILDLELITRTFSAALKVSGVEFGARHDELVRSFVASLAAKRLAILTGLSGSGKTQIALRLGDWLGKEHRMVVPVRPDWTGPDALFGYEDALKPLVKGRHTWHVPPVLEFILKAAHDPEYPYLLVLDEMNLAHVERYFADFLSGIESGEPCLPNLDKDEDGNWFIPVGAEPHIPMPENLFVVGTVNVDETTYMFSPKVLDRANTFEFRVQSDDLQVSLHKPLPLDIGEDELVRGFLAIAADDDWQEVHPAQGRDQFAVHLRTIHQMLAEGDFEFGHRVFYEALRYASMLAAAGNSSVEAALDHQVYQKVLPRLHGSRRRLEATLRGLAQYCYGLTCAPTGGGTKPFDPEAPGEDQPALPLSFQKVRRMLRSLRVNQFTSFTE